MMARTSRAYRRRVAALIGSLADDELSRQESVRFLRLDNEGLPEAVLIFDPLTRRWEKASLPLTADRVA